MWKLENNYQIKLGGNTYVNAENIIVCQGKPLFTLKRHEETGYLGIYFDIYNSSGQKVAAIKRNEVYLGNKKAYAVAGTLDSFTVTERSSGQVVCSISKREDAHPNELEISVQLYTPSGFLINATAEQTNIKGLTMKNCTFHGGTAISIA